MGDDCLQDYLDGRGFTSLACRVVKNLVVAAYKNNDLEALCCSSGFLEWPRWEELQSVFENDAIRNIKEEENLEAAVIEVVLPLIADLLQQVRDACGADGDEANSSSPEDVLQTPLYDFSVAWPMAFEQCKVLLEMHCRQEGFDISVETLFAREWVQLWHGWARLNEAIMNSGDSSVGELVLMVECAATFEEELQIFHGLLSMNETAPVVRSEEERLAELRAALSLQPGFAYGVGCNCLLDSLIQLLIEEGFFRDMSVMDRQSMAVANRHFLMNHPDESVHPVVRDRATNVIVGTHHAAYLQAEIHAEPSIGFLFEYAAQKGYALQTRPPHGFLIIVYSRLDSALFPPSKHTILREPMSECDPVTLPLYNRTGAATAGYHYEPLLPLDLLMPAEEAGSEGAGADDVMDDLPLKDVERDVEHEQPAENGVAENLPQDSDMNGNAAPSAEVGNVPKGAPAESVAEIHEASFALERPVPAPHVAASAQDVPRHDVEHGSAEDSDDSLDDSALVPRLRAKAGATLLTEQDYWAFSAQRLAEHLREKPTLPARWDNLEISFTDVDEAIALPLYSCPFKGCNFCTDDRWMFLQHFSRNNVEAPHAAVIEELCGVHLRHGFEPIDFVYHAMAVRENNKFPSLGMAITRRALRTMTQAYNDECTKAIMCATCNAVKATINGEWYETWDAALQQYVAHRNESVQYVNRNWFRTLERQKPGSLLNNLSAELFEKRYSNGTFMFAKECRYTPEQKNCLADIIPPVRPDDGKDPYARSQWNYVVPLSDATAVVCPPCGDIDVSAKRARTGFRDSKCVRLLGNTEDIRCLSPDAATIHAQDYKVEPYCRILCPECIVPMCRKCTTGLYAFDAAKQVASVPMSLANDHFYGYADKYLVDEKVTWIECACASTIWTTMMVYYYESGHLMEEHVKGAKQQTFARGNMFSFMLPWEDIALRLQEAEAAWESKSKKGPFQLLPHDEDALAALVHVQLEASAADVDLSKTLQGVKMRVKVVLALISLLRASGYPGYAAEYNSEDAVRERMHELYGRKYGDDPFIPKKVHAILLDAQEVAREKRERAALNKVAATCTGDSEGVRPPTGKNVCAMSPAPSVSKKKDFCGVCSPNTTSGKGFTADTMREDVDALCSIKNQTPRDYNYPVERLEEYTVPESIQATLTVHSFTDTHNREDALFFDATTPGSRTFKDSTLKMQPGTQLIDQYKASYIGMAHPHTIPRAVGGPDPLYEYKRGTERWRRPARHMAVDQIQLQLTEPYWRSVQQLQFAPPEVTLAEFVATVPALAWAAFRRDWNLRPNLYNLFFRHLINTQVSLCIKAEVEPDKPQQDKSLDLLKATEDAEKALCGGFYRDRFTGKLQPCESLAQVAYCSNVSPMTKKLVADGRFRTKNVPGTQEIRHTIGNVLVWYRVVYGNGIFMTISPGERHNYLSIRLSRYRLRDPWIKRHEREGTWIGADCPSINAHELEEFDVDVPGYDLRRILQAQDPHSVALAFQVQVRVQLAKLLGVRMCADCPHCDKFAPCQDRFGSNAEAMGGIAGRCDAIAGAVECQKSAGCLHLHFFAFVQRLHLHKDMQEIARKLSEGLVNATELKSYCANICCETYPLPDQIDEKVARMHKDHYWPAMKEEPQSRIGKQRFGELPTCVHEDTGRTPDFALCYSLSTEERTAKVKSMQADAASYQAAFNSALQENMIAAQHHMHVNGHVPNACKSTKNTKVCKHEFPKLTRMNVDRPIIICKRIAKRRHLTSSGNRSTLGTVLGLRNNEWLNGTAPGFCVGISGANTDVKVYDLVPIIDETHEGTLCTGKCVPEKDADKKRAAERSMRAMEKNVASYNGYTGGYVSKRAKPPQLLLKKTLSRLKQLYDRHSGATFKTHFRAMSARLLTDIEAGGTRRGAVETQNLCINIRHNDCLFAEFIRTCAEVHVAAKEWFNRLDGAEDDTSFENAEVVVTVKLKQCRKESIITCITISFL